MERAQHRKQVLLAEVQLTEAKTLRLQRRRELLLYPALLVQPVTPEPQPQWQEPPSLETEPQHPLLTAPRRETPPTPVDQELLARLHGPSTPQSSLPSSVS